MSEHALQKLLLTLIPSVTSLLVIAVRYAKTRGNTPACGGDVRSGAQVIHRYWFAAAIATAAASLVYLLQPGVGIAAVLVCVSSLTTTAIAWRMTNLPARLAGRDIEIERFVDDRVRFRRAAKVLLLALLQPYMFMCLLSKGATSIQITAWLITIAFFVGYVVWMLRSIRCNPTLNASAV